jgi:hypothetical protein
VTLHYQWMVVAAHLRPGVVSKILVDVNKL